MSPELFYTHIICDIYDISNVCLLAAETKSENQQTSPPFLPWESVTSGNWTIRGGWLLTEENLP